MPTLLRRPTGAACADRQDRGRRLLLAARQRRAARHTEEPGRLSLPPGFPAGRPPAASSSRSAATCRDRKAMLAEKRPCRQPQRGDVAVLYIRHLRGRRGGDQHSPEVRSQGRFERCPWNRSPSSISSLADADIAAGTVLTASGHHHSIVDVSARMVPAGKLGDDDVPVPFYLAANRKLKRAVRGGSADPVRRRRTR